MDKKALPSKTDEQEVLFGEVVDEKGDILEAPIWQRQEHIGETDTDYRDFLIYAGIEPRDRSLYAAWVRTSGKTTMFPDTYRRRYNQHEWERRANAWDIEKLVKAQDSWVMRDQKRRDDDYELGDLLKQFARDRLSQLEQDEISIGMALKFLEIGSELQKGAVPDVRLETDEIKRLMNMLPAERRSHVIAIVMEKAKK